jgi:hypothetical protein
MNSINIRRVAMLRNRTLSVRFVPAWALVILGSGVQETAAVTVYLTNLTNWTVAANWNNGLPDAVDVGQIPSGRIAQADGLIPSANISIQNGGTLRVTSANQVISTGNAITVENGGRMEYTISTGSLAAHNTINLMNGASIGRDISSTSPTESTSADDLNIVGLNATVFFREAHSGGRSFVFTGDLTGDISSTLIGENDGANNGIILITTTTNHSFAGKTIVRSSNGTTIGRLGAGGENPLGTGAAGPVEVQNLGVLRLRANTGVTGTGLIEVQTGGRIEIEGASSGNFISLETGTTLGRGETANTVATSTDTITLDSAASVIFGGMNSSRRLILSGTITADVNSDIFIQNDGVNSGYIQISSVSGNPIDGEIIVSGTSVTDRGRLAAGGTNPLGSGLANHVVVKNFGTIELLDNTGLQSATDIIEVQSGGRVEFSATNSTGNRIQLANNTEIGRTGTSPTVSTSNDIIEIATGASIRMFDANADPRKLVLAGPISGTNVTITVSNEGTFDEELRISSTTGNALTGQLFVKGDSTTNKGVLALAGTQPLGTMDVEVQQFGRLLVSPGSLNNQPDVTVLTGGAIAFRAAAGSAYVNSTLRGTGLVRAETTSASEDIDTALQALTLNDVLVAPGTSAGTLTFQATTLTFDAASLLEIELGSTSDLLVVQGNLDLTSGPMLNLLELPGLTAGSHVIATYTGTLTGQFGTINDLFTGFTFSSIDYGTLLNSQITVTIAEVLPAPEPNSGLLAASGLLFQLRRRRRGESNFKLGRLTK